MIPTSPMGVTLSCDGVDVAVHAPDADAVALCLFDAQDQETARLRLPDRSGPVFQGHFPGVPAGARYGLRAYGPWDPANGHRFNPAKLLLDPWATAIDRPFRLHPLLFDRDRPLPDDTAMLVPKAIVGAPSAEPVLDRPAFDWDHQVVYELHVRGFTMAHPEIPPAIRGTFAALAHPASLRHLTRLGVTTVELMPSAAWIDERHLPPLNLTDYWGYNPVAFLAPDPRLAPGGWPEVRAAVDALHAAGLSVVLDVVLNHSGESDELGPTLSLRGLDNAGYYRLAADRSRYVNDTGCGHALAMDRPVALRLGLDALRAWAAYGGLDGFRLDLAATLGRGPNGFEPNGPFLAAVEQDPLLSRCAMIAEPWDIGPGGYQLGAFPARWGEWNDRYRDSSRRFWRGDAGMLGDFATRFAGSADVFPQPAPVAQRQLRHRARRLHPGRPGVLRNQAQPGQRRGQPRRLRRQPVLEQRRGRSVLQSRRPGRARPRRPRAARRAAAVARHADAVDGRRGRSHAARQQHAYAQDNASAWFDWDNADEALVGFTAELVALRRALAPLFDGRGLTGQPAEGETLPDVAWHMPDGTIRTDWNGPATAR